MPDQLAEWLSLIVRMVDTATAGWKTVVSVRRALAATCARRARRKWLDDTGELKRLALVYADQGATPRDIAKMLRCELGSAQASCPTGQPRCQPRCQLHG